MDCTNTYYQMPKFLFSEELTLSSPAKILFMLLLERKRASEATGTPFTDKEGKIYILYKYETASKILGCHKNTVSVYMKELKDNGLLYTKKSSDYNQRIYLNTEFPCTGNTNSTERKSRSELNGNSVRNKKYINNNSFNKNTQKKKKGVEEISKPSYDLDAYTKKAFENPMLIFEKEKRKKSPLP